MLLLVVVDVLSSVVDVSSSVVDASSSLLYTDSFIFGSNTINNNTEDSERQPFERQAEANTNASAYVNPSGFSAKDTSDSRLSSIVSLLLQSRSLQHDNDDDVQLVVYHDIHYNDDNNDNDDDDTIADVHIEDDTIGMVMQLVALYQVKYKTIRPFYLRRNCTVKDIVRNCIIQQYNEED